MGRADRGAGDIFLVVIDSDWAMAIGADGQGRLVNPNDALVAQIALAREHRKLVVPVLIDGAQVPPTNQLPERIRPITTRYAACIDAATVDADLTRLLDGMRRVLEPEPVPSRAKEELASQPHVYISHAPRDLPRLRRLVKALLDDGLRVWIDDPRRLDPPTRSENLIGIGSMDQWRHAIDAAVTDAGCVLVVWSAAAVQSEIVHAEAAQVHHLGKTVSVSIDHVRVPLMFGELRTFPIGAVTERQLDAVVRAVREALASPERPA